MNNTQFETGEQLFDRLFSNDVNNQNNNSSIIKTLSNSLKVDVNIFSNEFDNGDLYEISGKPGSGKSEVILHLITSFILPGKWDIDLKFENKITKLQIDLTKWSYYPESTSENFKTKIILIDNDSKFCILKLFQILEFKIKQSVKLKQQSGETLVSKINKSMLESFIKKCLENLLVYKCYSNEQFLLTLASCEYCLKQEQHNRIQNNQNYENLNPLFIPIFIDTINSNFEFIDPLILNNDNHTEKYTVSLVNRLLTKYKKLICIIATRVEYDTTINKYDSNAYTYQIWQKIVNKHIKVVHEKENEFKLINNNGNEFIFTIGNNGIEFKN